MHADERNHATSYHVPKTEDIVPYDDDEAGSMTLINKQTGVMEKTSPAKAGCQPDAQNRRILGIARDAARIYDETKDEAYASMALGVLDTYLRGILYRNVPKDITEGHQNTITGMVTFEVIHEDAISSIAPAEIEIAGQEEEDTSLFTVCIDAGHGGKDIGSDSKGRIEKDDTLKLAKALSDALSERQIRVVMTRDEGGQRSRRRHPH